MFSRGVDRYARSTVSASGVDCSRVLTVLTARSAMPLDCGYSGLLLGFYYVEFCKLGKFPGAKLSSVVREQPFHRIHLHGSHSDY